MYVHFDWDLSWEEYHPMKLLATYWKIGSNEEQPSDQRVETLDVVASKK